MVLFWKMGRCTGRYKNKTHFLRKKSKMKKIKINRYFSKKYDDIDVYGMKFLSDNLSDAWEKVFDIFPDSKIIALIEAEFDSQQLSALIDENMRTYIDILSVSETTSIVICDKTIFLKLLTKLNISDLEAIYVAGGLHDNDVSDEIIHTVQTTPALMVAKNLADITLFINFDENEMTISVPKIEYAAEAVKKYLLEVFEK